VEPNHKQDLKLIKEFVKGLSKKNKVLLDEYIYFEHISKKRTGGGKIKNYFTELAEQGYEDGIKTIKELLKFKRMVKRQEIKNKKENPELK